jgi:hypothetical protein
MIFEWTQEMGRGLCYSREEGSRKWEGRPYL